MMVGAFCLPAKVKGMNRRVALWSMVGVLLAGAWLRWTRFGRYKPC